METTKVFMSGRSQAVRIPKQWRFSGTEVFLRPLGNGGIELLPVRQSGWKEFFAHFTCPDFKLDRDNGEPQKRRDIL